MGGRARRRVVGIDVASLRFMPGWRRTLDRWCHARCRSLTAATGALVRPFAWLRDEARAARRLLAPDGAIPLFVIAAPGVALNASIQRARRRAGPWLDGIER